MKGHTCNSEYEKTQIFSNFTTEHNSFNHLGNPEYAIINLYFTMPFCMFQCAALKVGRENRVNVEILCKSAIYLIAYVDYLHLLELM